MEAIISYLSKITTLQKDPINFKYNSWALKQWWALIDFYEING